MNKFFLCTLVTSLITAAVLAVVAAASFFSRGKYIEGVMCTGFFLAALLADQIVRTTHKQEEEEDQ